MKDKFNKIKKDNKAKFFLELGNKTGCDPHNIKCNWFGKLFFKIPKNKVDTTEKFLDTFLEWQSEKIESEKLLDVKYFRYDRDL